jgi:hypothetical protein
VAYHLKIDRRVFCLKVGNEMQYFIREDTWRPGVYGSKDDKLDPEYWDRVRELVTDRDKRRCQACRKLLPKRALSVHHILPRSLGGTEDLDNLITLCFSCHDAIEELDLRSAYEIIGYMVDPEKSRLRIQQERREEHEAAQRSIDAERPEWHSSVYGGCRKRRKYL